MIGGLIIFLDAFVLTHYIVSWMMKSGFSPSLKAFIEGMLFRRRIFNMHVCIPRPYHVVLDADRTVREVIKALKVSFASKVATSRLMETGYRSILVLDNNAGGSMKLTKRKERPPGIDPRWPHRRIRILLVDDEKAFADTLANRLRKRAFDVSRAYNGSDAIQCLSGSDFDVAVIDILMGQPNGIDVLEKLRKTASNMPVIVLTGQGNEEAVEEAMAAGAFDCLLKPYEMDALLSKIETAYFSEREPIE